MSSAGVSRVPLSPVLRSLTAYPFVRLEEAKRQAAARGLSLIDFGVGDPREPTDPMIRQALVDGLEERMGYPLAPGLPELRQAITGWISRRFDVAVDAQTQVLPTLGSKEAIYSLAQVVVDRGGRDLVVTTEPGYPVPERGALFAGGTAHTLPLREENAFLPDLDAVPEETWERTAILWLNYPNNPTGAVAPHRLFEHAAELARRHGFLLASDEAYSELWFDEPPPSALQIGDVANVVVFNTLSKRSSMTGYRCGFMAGDPELIAALRAFRPTIGTTPQVFVQRAAVAAWNDEGHVERARDAYRRKREILSDVLGRKGLRIAGSTATMYLWVAVAGPSEAFAERLLEHGIVVAPGAYLGPSGEGFVRFALVPTIDECERAAVILEEAL